MNLIVIAHANTRTINQLSSSCLGAWHCAKGEEDKPYTGKFIKRYGNGQKEIETLYVHGQKHGVETYWFKNGKKWKINNWKYNSKDGVQIVWKKEPIKRGSNNETDIFEYVYSNGKLITTRKLGFYQDSDLNEIKNSDINFKFRPKEKEGNVYKAWEENQKQDLRYIARDNVKLMSDPNINSDVIKLLRKGAKVKGWNNVNGFMHTRVDKKTKGYILISDLVKINPIDIQYNKNNNEEFSSLWKQHGGFILDTGANPANDSLKNFSILSTDKQAPIINLNQGNLITVTDQSIGLNGSVVDDSSVSEVSINGGLISINDSDKFDTTMYLGLGKNKFTIEAWDIFGNKASKTITVVRNKAIVKNKDKRLVPPTIQMASNPTSIALIIGLDDYKSMPNAPWAESDASTFYDYARNALGIPVERIRLITGQESDRTAIWKSLEQWLPSQVDKNKSNVYVYFAGHGLASEDGKDAYLMPYDGDTSMLSRTAIPRKDVISGLDSLKARSVTLFMDTCYSGSAKGGKQTLVASRGLRIVKKNTLADLPSNFTLFSAAANDETAISHPTQKNGLFSYWMMRGLGGEADNNNDRKITNGELHAFISDKVQKTAISKGHNQHPQLVGDKDKVIASW